MYEQQFSKYIWTHTKPR